MFKDQAKIVIMSHILIKDKDSGEVLLNKGDNKVERENKKEKMTVCVCVSVCLRECVFVCV